jgi:glyceraldehyde 3-phosphate dehydrogenase
MSIKLAINGPGRVGRNFIWIWSERKKKGKTDIDIVAINGVRDLEGEKGLRHFMELLKFDSTYGHHYKEIANGKDEKGTWIEIEGSRIYLYNHRGDLSELPWKDHGVDLVVESTGLFRKRDQLEGHLKAGARKVIISAPGKEGIDTSVVMGAAEDIPEGENMVDCGSCTTNAIASVVKTVNERWGIERGFMITVHAPTDSQRILDASHKDIRRARSLLNNIIPTTTGAAKSVTKIMPELKGKLDAVALRIPGITTGSIVGLIADVKKEVTREEVNKIFEGLCKGELKGILGCADNEIVSSHIVGSKESGIVDLPMTNVINGKQLVVWAWYDNERGYTNRLIDVSERFGKA